MDLIFRILVIFHIDLMELLFCVILYSYKKYFIEKENALGFR